jgi:hypothetical protein
MEEVRINKTVAETLLRSGKTPNEIAEEYKGQFSGQARVVKALLAKWGLVEKKIRAEKDEKPEKPRKKNKLQNENKAVLLKPEVLAGKEFKYELGEELKIMKGDGKLSCEDLGRLIQELQEIQRMQQVG